MLFIFLAVLSDSEKDLLNNMFKEINAKLFNISFRILHSHADAEEAVAQTFLKMIDHVTKISQLPCPQRVPYCVVIVKNECTNILRKQRRLTSIDNLEQSGHEVFEDTDEISKFIEKDKLIELLKQLSDEEQYLIYLRFFRNMSYKKISEIMGGSEEALKKRGQRVIRKLQILYKEGEQDVSCNE